ncbi:hypothetical protein HC6_0027 [Escherichia phage HC6]|nr:hypothetical protein HC6_0027 [Escherichia phage HC6]UTI75210.1 hypothetical protein [Escherichia phage 6947]
MSAPHMPVMNENGLLECPCCASSEIYLVKTVGGWSYVECDSCLLKTEHGKSPELAIKTWNRRNGHLYTAEDFNQAAEDRDYGL